MDVQSGVTGFRLIDTVVTNEGYSIYAQQLLRLGIGSSATVIRCRMEGLVGENSGRIFVSADRTLSPVEYLPNFESWMFGLCSSLSLRRWWWSSPSFAASCASRATAPFCTACPAQWPLNAAGSRSEHLCCVFLLALAVGLRADLRGVDCSSVAESGGSIYVRNSRLPNPSLRLDVNEYVGVLLAFAFASQLTFGNAIFSNCTFSGNRATTEVRIVQ